MCESDQETAESPKPNRALINFAPEVSDIFGLGKAAEKLSPAGKRLVDGFSKALNPAVKYLDARAEGAARRHNAVADAQAIAELSRDASLDPAIADQIKSRLLVTEVYKQQNLNSAAQRALKLTESAKKAGSELDPDFVFEWIDGAQDASTSQVQDLWARVLAEAPQTENGRISKPSILLLKQFDKNIAESFQNLVRVYKFLGWLPFQMSSQVELTLDMKIDFLMLQDIGAIGRNDGSAKIEMVSADFNQLQFRRQFLHLIPSLLIWHFNTRAADIANCIAEDLEDFTKSQKEAFWNQFIKWVTSKEGFYVQIAPKLPNPEKESSRIHLVAQNTEYSDDKEVFPAAEVGNAKKHESVVRAQLPEELAQTIISLRDANELKVVTH